jgi:RNA polymerase sigma-70 factor (ECF subfamily)
MAQAIRRPVRAVVFSAVQVHEVAAQTLVAMESALERLTTIVASWLPGGHAAPLVFLFGAIAALGVAVDREQRLMEQLAKGDAKALRVLYDNNASKIMGLALRILRAPREAEDVVQETFVEVWRRSREYSPSRGGVTTWLLTIARTRSIDRLRSRDAAARASTAAASEPAPASPTPPLEALEQRQRRERLSAALSELPEEQRAVLALAYFEGLTHREIAARTGDPLGTVKTRVRLGMEKLAAVLADEAGP